MKTDNLKIHKVFSGGGDVHYVLPHFQREYAWGKDNWDALLNDALAIYQEYLPPKVPEHFLGSLVVIEDGMQDGMIPVFKLVDGQQRLTTISLVLCALREIVKDSTPQLHKKIQKMLVNDTEADQVRFKLLPTAKYGDRQAYIDIIDGGHSSNTTSNIPKAYDYLYRELSHKITSGEIEQTKFFEALVSSFQLVFINLNKDESPYKIFESLNAKGKPLSQADLVRNYLAMRLPGSKQEAVFNKSWSKIEDLLQEKRVVGRSRLGELTAFLRHYLAMRSGVLCNEEHIYARFRDRMEQEFNGDEQFIEELNTLKRFAEYYNKFLRPTGDINEGLLARLKIMEVSTAYPFLMAAYEAHFTGTLNSAQLKDLLSVLENFIVRLYICGEPTNYLNKMFPTLWKELNLSQFATSLRQTLAAKSYPTDQKVYKALLKNKLYNSTTRERTILVLESIEQSLWNGSDVLARLNGKASLEHIMPQSIASMSEWQAELGDNWQQVHQENLHTLGNLTLVTLEWNSSLSNRPFIGHAPYQDNAGQSGKKKLLSQHGLRLNSHYFADIERWDERAIQKRAEFLGDKIVQIWPSFGTVPTQTTVNGSPESVVIDDQTFAVTTWRDVTFKTTEYLIQQGKFEALRKSAPNYFELDNSSKQWNGETRLLSNGYRLYVSLSSNSAIALCRRFVSAAGMVESKWKVNVKS